MTKFLAVARARPREGQTRVREGETTGYHVKFWLKLNLRCLVLLNNNLRFTIKQFHQFDNFPEFSIVGKSTNS
jgi:hypothetical protein